MRKKRMVMGLAAAVLSMTTILAGCSSAGTGSAPTSGNGGSGGNDTYAVGMVTDVGGVNDNSFNQSAWEGLQKAKDDLKIKADYLQSKSATDYTPNLNNYVQSGAKLVWGIGFAMEKDLKNVAKTSPDSKFGIVDFAWDQTPKNVVSVVFKEEEGSFLEGVIAAKMTKTKKIGFLGGAEMPLIKKFEYGFRAGAATVDPGIKVISNYAGTFDTPDKGKTFANTMYGEGVDIIYHASGKTGDGLFTEAKEQRKAGKKVWVIGVDKDQSFMGPDVTLSSMVKKVNVAVYDITKQTKEGNFPGGQIKSYGLKEGGVGPADTTKNNVPADVLKLVDDYKQQIIDGKIKVPKTADEFKAAFPKQG